MDDDNFMVIIGGPRSTGMTLAEAHDLERAGEIKLETLPVTTRR